MKRVIKNGDRVFFGPIKATIISIFNSNHALILSETSHTTLKVWDDLQISHPQLLKVMFFYLKEYAGDYATHLIKQQRFCITSISQLRFNNEPKPSYRSLIKKRHLYIAMAKHYIRNKHKDNSIQRICSKIEDMQIDIETLESNAKWHFNY